MRSIATSEDLKKAIQELQQQQAVEWPLLKEEFFRTTDGLKPINIIKNTFKDAFALPDLKTEIVNTAIGLTAGFVAKEIIIGKKINPISKLAGVLLEVLVSNKVTRNAGEIKSISSHFINKIFGRHDESGKP